MVPISLVLVLVRLRILHMVVPSIALAQRQKAQVALVVLVFLQVKEINISEGCPPYGGHPIFQIICKKKNNMKYHYVNPSIYYCEKTSRNEYLLYNSIKHIPIKVTSRQYRFFNILLSNRQNEAFVNKNKELEEFKDFVKQLKKINFLSTETEWISKDSLLKKFDSTKKCFYYHLTHQCNLKCSYCYNKEQRKEVVDLSFDQWLTIMNRTLPYAHTIILTGGEPTLYTHFNKIVKYIHDFDNTVRIEMISNANTDYQNPNISEVLPFIKSIKISCDSINDVKQERIGFNKTIFNNNLKVIDKLGMKGNLKIASVLLKGNVDEVLATKKFCEKYGCDFSSSVFIPTKKDVDKMPTVEDVNIFHESQKDQKQNDSIRYKTITCQAGSAIFSVDSQGDVYPCQSFHFADFRLGNFLTQTLEEIYNSQIATMLRVSNDVEYKTICRECNLKYICAGGCAANTYALEGNILNHPQTMCPYYKAGALRRLKNVEF